MGPVVVGPATLTFHAQVLAGTLWIGGLVYTYLGIISRITGDRTGQTAEQLQAFFDYTRTVCTIFAVIAIGCGLDLWFVETYVSHGLRILPEDVVVTHLSTFGLFLIIAGFMTFAFTLVVHAVAERLRESYKARRGVAAR
jgi:hypothetical protein